MRPAPPRREETPQSSWEVLRLAPGASLDEVRRAFRQRALETHPDTGGDDASFRAVRRAYERLVAKLARQRL
jgi:curved DNA-binding protein CbpA